MSPFSQEGPHGRSSTMMVFILLQKIPNQTIEFVPGPNRNPETSVQNISGIGSCREYIGLGKLFGSGFKEASLFFHAPGWEEEAP